MDDPHSRPVPTTDRAWTIVGQSITGTGVLVAVIAVAAVVARDPAAGVGPDTGTLWLLWTLAGVLVANGFVLWMVFDQRSRALLDRGGPPA